MGSSRAPEECEVTLAAELRQMAIPDADRPRPLERLILRPKEERDVARDPIRPRGAVPVDLQPVDIHVSAWPVWPSPSATAKPDRPCWQIGEVRRLLLVQWFGRRDRPLGEGRRSAPVPERDP